MQRLATLHLAQLDPTPEPERTLLEHLPMVRFVAKRIHGRLPKSVDIEDILSAGMVGLIQAFAKFNPAMNVRFDSYAQFRVRGAIMDSLRTSDWAPRELRHKGRAIQEAIRMLASEFGRAPEEEEVAAELKTSLPAYQKLLGELHNLEIGSLHRKRDDDSGEEELVYVPGRPEDDPLFRCMKVEMAKRLTDAIEELPERERLVITLFYYEEMTRSEIALALEIDGTRVSQIRASAVLHLRSALSDIPQRSNEHVNANVTCIRSSRPNTLKPVLNTRMPVLSSMPAA